jgi:mandelate racemase
MTSLSSPIAESTNLPAIVGIRVRPVVAPLKTPLRTASGVMASAPLVLIDVETSAGVTGSAYIFTYTPIVLPAIARLLDDVAGTLAGQPLAPASLTEALRKRFVLLGTTGLLDMALAGIDMALWDAHARWLKLPLVRLLGGSPRPVRAYASFGMDGLDGALRAADAACATGFSAIKIKIGYETLAEDLAVVRSVRRVIGDRVALMVDYNQALSVPEAIRRGLALDQEQLEWIEEPTACDDLVGHGTIAAALQTPLQLGENAWGPRGMLALLRHRASDLAMPDLMKIGGVTGWLAAVAVCDAHAVPVSNHFYQEMSVHLLAATPAAHYLEYFGIADAVMRRPCVATDGFVSATDAPGSGIEWDEAAVARFALN